MKKQVTEEKLFNILGTRKIWYTISSVMIIATFIAWIAFGFNLGIDFTGGSLMQVKYPDVAPSSAEIADQLSGLDLSEVVVQPSDETTVILKVPFVSNEQRQEILSTLGEGVVEESFESIGPTIGQELREKSITAIILVVIAIIVYVAVAFRKVSQGPVPSWAFGVSAIIALLHDILITLGVFLVLGHYFGVEINVMFITALLTILGFSVNDTIVVFDRIREGLRRSQQENFEGVINESINHTMMRSLNTSITTLIVLFALYLFGGETIKYFVLALIIGITAGTYSSIFIASPLLLLWQKVLKR
ncbi:MAG: protein translocase subunit SecF [bacterium]|nr:protein translocase subunit SecF [bacterium]